jgi:hypothetical protein
MRGTSGKCDGFDTFPSEQDTTLVGSMLEVVKRLPKAALIEEQSFFYSTVTLLLSVKVDYSLSLSLSLFISFSLSIFCFLSSSTLLFVN